MFAAIIKVLQTDEVSLFGEYTSRDVFMKEIAKTGAITHGTDEFFIRQPDSNLSMIVMLKDVGNRTKKPGLTVPVDPAIPYRHKMV